MLTRDPRLNQIAHESDPPFNIPYQWRNRESELVVALGSKGPVLVLGTAMAGKTTLVLHLLAETFAQQPVWVPKVPDGAGTIGVDGCFRECLVVFDDIDRYLGGKTPFSGDGLDALLESGRSPAASLLRL